MHNEHNILIGSGVQMCDQDLFFGPLHNCDEFETIPDNWRFPQLLKALGIFQSTGDAKKNGWNKEIPEGWTDITIGKLKHRICILKIILCPI